MGDKESEYLIKNSLRLPSSLSSLGTTFRFILPGGSAKSCFCKPEMFFPLDGQAPSDFEETLADVGEEVLVEDDAWGLSGVVNVTDFGARWGWLDTDFRKALVELRLKT